MKYILPFLIAGILLLVGCSKKEEPTPTYADFTPVNGSFTIYRAGQAPTVLSDLQLRKEEGYPGQTEMYHFKGGYDAQQTLELQFVVDKNRTGSGPWNSSLVNILFFSRATSLITLGVTGAGTLSISGKRVSADFTQFYSTDVRGTLK